MSPRQLMAVSHMLDQRERREMLTHAISARAAQTDKRGWQDFTRKIEG
jgi:hypothetical protein